MGEDVGVGVLCAFVGVGIRQMLLHKFHTDATTCTCIHSALSNTIYIVFGMRGMSLLFQCIYMLCLGE